MTDESDEDIVLDDTQSTQRQQPSYESLPVTQVLGSRSDSQTNQLDVWHLFSQDSDWNLSDFFDINSGFLLPIFNTMSGPNNQNNPPPALQNVTVNNNYKVKFPDRN